VAGIFGAVGAALKQENPELKCQAVYALAGDSRPDFSDRENLGEASADPGRPARPLLVDPLDVPRRRLGNVEGRVALVHAIAHIEFNAINLALDAAWRFRDMPELFTIEWLSVAQDEARHFQMLSHRLNDLGHVYGDFPAHDGLWAMARQTAGSCLARMALVPRVLEARGLDVTPGMITRLRTAGDIETVEILEVILEEEIRHVAIGTHWFRYCCERECVEPLATFFDLLARYFGRPRGPFNIDARLLAGFTSEELDTLVSQAN
jgi:uncharacterized ferritin-like protein (DUF455 family)